MAYPGRAGPWREWADGFFGVNLRIIGAVFFGRLVIDIGTRSFYPFIPQLSEGLGLTVVGFSWLLFSRGMAGVTGPIFGMLSDRIGRRKVMAVGLLCQTAGVLGLAATWRWSAVLPVVLTGLSVAAFLPAQQAYIGDQAAYHKRGRALGSVEFAWAASAIFILPIVGWLIDSFGWRAPFMILGLLSLAASAVIWRRLPSTEHRSQSRLSLAEARDVCLRPNVLASIVVALLLFAAAESIVTVWGIWLVADFGLTAAALGLVATVIGVAELSGAGLSSLFIDRIGKRRGSGFGFLAAAILVFTLPVTRSTPFVAVAALCVLAISFEFSIVSTVPLYAEQAPPAARGTVFALKLVGMAIGAAIGAPMATTLWYHYGLGAVSLVAAACLIVCFILVWKFLRESADEA